MSNTPNDTKRKPFSMIREFHLADWFTLGNAVWGVGSMFSIITFIQTGAVQHAYYACALVLAALVFLLWWAAAVGAVGPELWGGSMRIAGFTLHPLVLLYALSGSLMISRLRIPKL